MQVKFYPLLAVAAVACASAAWGDDSPSAQPIKSPQQKMQQCMAHEHANNSALSKQELKKACAAKIQSDENHPSRPQPLSDPGQT